MMVRMIKDQYRISYQALMALRVKAGLKDIPPEKVIRNFSLQMAEKFTLVPLAGVTYNIK